MNVCSCVGTFAFHVALFFYLIVERSSSILDMNALGVVIMLTSSFSVCSVTATSQGKQATADQYSMLCPFTDQCYRNATKLLPHDTQLKACCTSCSCHDDCVAMGNCCPDKRKPVLKPVQVSCKETLVKRTNDYTSIGEEVNRGHDAGIKRYFVVDNCPGNVTRTETAKLCYGTENNSATLEDLVWVSDLDSGRIYQNEYCAKCHGVTNIIQWQLVTTCFDILLANISTAVTTVLSDLCSIIVVVPEIIADTTEKYLCFLPDYTRCNETGLWDNYDEELEEKCLKYTSTYFHLAFFGYDLYRNVFCFACNQGHPARPKGVCLLSENGVTSLITPFTALLDYNRYTQPMTAEQECGIAEIMDKFKKICRELICPFPRTPFYGTCIQLSTYVLGLKVQINFKVTVLGNFTESNFNVSESGIGRAVHNAFSKSVGFKRAKCPICYIIVMQEHSPESHSLQLYLLTMVYTTSRCQYDRIAELVSVVLAKEINTTLPDKTYLPIRVTIDPRHEEQILPTTKVIYERNAELCDTFSQYHVRNSLFCPQIEMDKSEMSSLEGSTDDPHRMSIEDIKIEMVSNRSVRICVDDYYTALEQPSSGFRLLLTRSSVLGCCFMLGFIL